MKKVGIWTGIAFCFLGILSLSLGLVPLARAFFYKPLAVKIPGQVTLNLRLPGRYLGVASLLGVSAEDKRKAFTMDYWLSDPGEKNFFTVNRFPGRNYFSEKEDAQTPLFELIVKEKGAYVFTSDYPIGTEGPQIPTVLHYYEADHIRSQLIVGAVMFLILGVSGGILIWKNVRPVRPGI